MLDSYRYYLRLLARTGLDATLRGKVDPSDLVQDALFKTFQRFGQFHGATDADRKILWSSSRAESPRRPDMSLQRISKMRLW